MIDVAAFNTYILFCIRNPDTKTKNSRKIFLLSLGNEMVVPFMKIKLQTKGQHVHVIREIKACLPNTQLHSTESPAKDSNHQNKRGRCKYHPRKKI